VSALVDISIKRAWEDAGDECTDFRNALRRLDAALEDRDARAASTYATNAAASLLSLARCLAQADALTRVRDGAP
jgi:hypothetical protein